MENIKKSYNFDSAPFSTHSLLLAEVPDGSRVLEIGTAAGYLGSYLISEKKCKVWGVEPEEKYFNQALNCGYEKMFKQTAEEFIADLQNDAERFDVILLGDVLEHMVNPEVVLQSLKKVMKPEGKIVVSLPNIAHYSIRLALLLGKWETTDVGILDRTHLHFYTRDSAKIMFVNLGFNLIKIRPCSGGVERFGINKLMGVGQKFLFLFPKILAQQFIFIAKA